MSENKEKEEEKPVVAKTAVDLQRLKLMKLMKNPEKPIILPERPKAKNTPTVPEFVRNVMGSSAGAGSGEFHVYRHLRRKEYARQKFIQEKGRKELMDEEYHKKLEENRKLADEATAKRRAKRLKKKQKWKEKKRMKGTGSNKESRNEENDKEEEEEEEDSSDKEDENREDRSVPDGKTNENGDTEAKTVQRKDEEESTADEKERGENEEDQGPKDSPGCVPEERVAKDECTNSEPSRASDVQGSEVESVQKTSGETLASENENQNANEA